MMMKLSFGFSELLFLSVEMRRMEFVNFEDLGTVVALMTLLFTLVALVMVELILDPHTIISLGLACNNGAYFWILALFFYLRSRHYYFLLLALTMVELMFGSRHYYLPSLRLW